MSDPEYENDQRLHNINNNHCGGEKFVVLAGDNSSSWPNELDERHEMNTSIRLHKLNLKNIKSCSEEMLDAEKAGLVERVHDLERQVLEHKDEIVCLKSTLADVLRRLNTIDNSYEINSRNNNSDNNISSSANITSTKNFRFSQTTINRINSSVDERKFRRTPSRVISSPSRSVPRNNLNQKSIHHSNGSLHSDSLSNHSVSPTPSPSPKQNSSQNLQPGPGMGKRWSSTGDFVSSSPVQSSSSSNNNSGNNGFSRFTTKSLLNLNSANTTKQSAPQSYVQRKDDEDYIKLFIRGRPIVLYLPEPLITTFDLTKVSPTPNKRLKLDWVYGYRGKDCRSNLYQLPTGEMVYFVAAVVILYNMDEQSQRHYIGHTDDVKSLAVHPNKLLVATGQCGGHDGRETMPHIRIWNSVSLTTLNIVGIGEFTGSVNCLSFSRADSGNILVAIDDSPDKIISIWDWQKKENGRRITETKCSVDTIVAVEFHPLDRGQIISIGKNHIAFWSLDQNGMLYKRMGIFENREKPKYVTSITFTQTGDVVTGDSNGNITVWGRGTNVISRFLKKIHDGSIFSICSLRNGGFVSGGKDGRLVLLDESLRLKAEQIVEAHFGAVRVVTQGKGAQLLIGTTKNCILSGDFTLGVIPIVMGHTDELWAMSTHPQVAQFVTGGRDRLLQLWDSLSHSVVWSKDIGEQVQCVQFSNDGQVIIVGAFAGRWMVFDVLSRECLAIYTDGQDIIQTIKYSPDGTLLAIGSKDGSIYVYQTTKSLHRFAKIGKCQGHSSFITHMDWSQDGQVLRTNSGDYEVLYWNPSLCRQITNPSSLRNLEWASQNCTISFETLGVWTENMDGTDINSVAKSSNSHLLATGDDFGRVRLYSFPVSQPKSISHSYGGHSSHVTSIQFMYDDARLLSAGGGDTSILQWRIL